MKKKLHSVLWTLIAGAIILGTVFIICAMLAGPLYFGWNYSFGLIYETVTYLKVFKLIVIFVMGIGLITGILNAIGKSDNG